MAEEKTEHESGSEESHDLEASETPEHEEAHGSEEAHEHESSDANESAAAKGPRRRKVSRKIRRYEVPIDAGEGGGSQTVLRVKPLGFWKMFFAVMLGFFASLLLFLVTAVLAVIILGNVLWNTVETRVGNWVTDIANRVSDELDTADKSLKNITDTVEQTLTGDGSTTTSTTTSGNDSTSNTSTTTSGNDSTSNTSTTTSDTANTQSSEANSSTAASDSG